jgi:hypothetical protein
MPFASPVGGVLKPQPNYVSSDVKRMPGMPNEIAPMHNIVSRVPNMMSMNPVPSG